MTAADICRHFEELELKAYQCPGGKWTCGYGHTAGVGPDTTCDKAQAEKWLEEDLLAAASIVRKHVKVKVPLTDNQWEALVSLVFNIGPGAPGIKSGFVWLKTRGVNGKPQHSSLLRALNAGNFVLAAAEFETWRKAGGKILPGLVKRRAVERALFEGREVALELT